MMQYHTHLAFGAAAGAAVMTYIPQVSIEQTFLYSGGLLVGALLPDIDHPNSKISRAVPVLGKAISSTTGHRTFFHSALFIGLLFLLYQTSIPADFITGLITGVVSHVVGDMFTVKGVHFFYPIKKTIRSPLAFHTGGIVEQLLFIVFIGLFYSMLAV
ncbi:metal-dependent hydrolase [Bacillus tianshenii]|nr:metal-dependent hydrolase [Bacillus tianshenii]